MTDKFVAIYSNYARVGGAFSYGDWEADLPLTNLQTTDIGEVARSSDAATTSTRFKLDLGMLRQVGGLAIGPTNLSPGAEYRIRSYEDSGYTTVLYDSGVKALEGTTASSLELEWENPGFWYGILDPEDIVANPWIIEIIPEASLEDSYAEYWLVEIFDTANSDGFVEIGYCLVGRTFRPTFNFDESNAVGMHDLVDVVEALGGHRDFWHRGSRRSLTINFPYLPGDEGWGDVYRMMSRLGTHEPLFVVPNYDDTDNLQKRSFLATFQQTPEMRLLLESRVAVSFQFEEVL